MPHEDQMFAMGTALEAVNTAVLLGLTDAMILADANLTDLLADIDAVAALAGQHSDREHVFFRIKNALRAAYAVGVLTDVNIAATDTIAGLRAIFTAAIPGTTATQQGRRLWGE